MVFVADAISPDCGRQSQVSDLSYTHLCACMHKCVCILKCVHFEVCGCKSVLGACTHLDDPLVRILFDKNIFGFQISMYEMLIVHVMESLTYLQYKCVHSHSRVCASTLKSVCIHTQKCVEVYPKVCAHNTVWVGILGRRHPI